MAPPGWFRLIRAGVFAAVCVALSKAGHDLMAPHPAPAWTGWAAIACVGAVGYRLADRRRPLWWILLAVQVVQLCLHVWFSSRTPADGGAVPAHPGMATHGGLHQVTVIPMSQGGGLSLGMFGAHALAGVVVAVWLYAGERALWHALALIARLLVGRTLRSFFLLLCGGGAVGRRPAGALLRSARDETPLVHVTLRHALVRRGPPRAADFRTYVSS
jgi:hypothetical protein